MERPFASASDADLLRLYSELREQVADLQQEIEERMRERDAVGIPDDQVLCEWPVRYEYFQERLTPLKEVLNGWELAECYVPAWIETKIIEHAEAFNIIKLLPVARRHGKEAMDIIERGRSTRRGSLTVKRKPGASSTEEPHAS